MCFMLIVFHVYIIIHAAYTMAITPILSQKIELPDLEPIILFMHKYKKLEFTAIATKNITLFIYQFATKN